MIEQITQHVFEMRFARLQIRLCHGIRLNVGWVRLSNLACHGHPSRHVFTLSVQVTTRNTKGAGSDRGGEHHPKHHSIERHIRSSLVRVNPLVDLRLLERSILGNKRIDAPHVLAPCTL